MTSPLPTDYQVVRAIKDRKREFINNYKSTLGEDYDVQDSMYFHHICTVLDHAEKLFNTPFKEWLDTEKQEEKDTFNNAVEIMADDSSSDE